MTISVVNSIALLFQTCKQIAIRVGAGSLHSPYIRE